MTAKDVVIEDIRAQRVAYVIIHSGFILAGVVTVILGPILPILITRWSMTDERAGLFFTSQFCGNLLGIASLGALISRRGYGQTLGLGFTLIGLGIAALNFSNQMLCLTATAVFGFGLGLVLSATNLWVAEVAASRKAAALSILNLAWGIGAIACPALVMLAQRGHRVALLLFVIAGLAFVHAMGLASMDINLRAPGNQPSNSIQIEGRSVIRAVITLTGLFFLYCGTESAIGGWAATFARRIGDKTEHWWELAPMFFWAGLLTGRALSPSVLHKFTPRMALSSGLTLAGFCNAVLLAVAAPQIVAVSLVGSGLGFACIFPLLVASLVETFGEQARRLATIIFAGANLGGATIPWLVGFTSTRLGNLKAGLAVLLVACGLMLVLVQLLNLQRSPEVQHDPA